jgi:hypothetical protein
MEARNLMVEEGSGADEDVGMLIRHKSYPR